MTAPRTYADWLPLLDGFRSGDNKFLAEMQGGTIEWTNVVAERWTRQVTDCLNERLTVLSREFQHALDRAAGDHLAIGNAMLLARRTLEILRNFAALPAANQDVRAFLSSQLESWATQTQQSLERNAMLVRHDQGRLLKTIREHALTARPATVPSAKVQSEPAPQPSAPIIRGRRVLL